MSLQGPRTARLEIKFAAYESEYRTLKQWLHLNAAAFRVPYPSRWVNNVYFDTYDYMAFEENLSGASDRTKVRYRWYGKSMNLDHGVLEIKQKRNYFGWKLRFAVEDSPYEDGDTWRQIKDKISSQISADGRCWLSFNPFPIMRNQYRRDYFLSADSKIRATVDTHQAVWDQRIKPSPNTHAKANLPRTLVVEFKFDRIDRQKASEILRGIPLRVSRHSKYMNAVRAISQCSE